MTSLYSIVQQSTSCWTLDLSTAVHPLFLSRYFVPCFSFLAFSSRKQLPLLPHPSIHPSLLFPLNHVLRFNLNGPSNNKNIHHSVKSVFSVSVTIAAPRSFFPHLSLRPPSLIFFSSTWSLQHTQLSHIPSFFYDLSSVSNCTFSFSFYSTQFCLWLFLFLSYLFLWRHTTLAIASFVYGVLLHYADCFIYFFFFLTSPHCSNTSLFSFFACIFCPLGDDIHVLSLLFFLLFFIYPFVVMR